MTTTSACLYVKIEKGVGKFTFPESFKEENFHTELTCLTVNLSPYPTTDGQLVMIVCDGSVFRQSFDKPYVSNIVGYVNPHPSQNVTQTLHSMLTVPLNMVSTFINLRCVNANNDLMQVNGEVILHLKGNMKAKVLA